MIEIMDYPEEKGPLDAIRAFCEHCAAELFEEKPVNCGCHSCELYEYRTGDPEEDDGR